MHSSTVHMEDYKEGLRRINKAGHNKVNAHAGVLRARLNTDAGRTSLTAAEATLKHKLTQKQASEAAITFQKSLEGAMCDALTKARAPNTSTSTGTARPVTPSAVPSSAPLTVADLEVDQHSPVTELADPINPIIEDNNEIEELRRNLNRTSHPQCEWKVKGDCVACRFQVYQHECINALDGKSLKRSEIADVMALIGVFAPFIPTPRMRSVFGRMLDDLLTPTKFPEPDIDDLAVMKAVRQRLNGERDLASEAIRPLDRKKRLMFETLMENLPIKSDKTIAEQTFVTDYVSPVIRGTLALDDERVQISFPNTECQIQKQQGMKPDKPDILIKIRGQEAVFGEVTGPRQAGDTAKNAWDLFRLARFGKAFLDNGNAVALLIQVIYNNGTSMRLRVKTRGMFMLEEIGAFEVPTKIALIPALAATLPTLLEAQGGIQRILDGDMNTLKRSWGYGDIRDAKKRLL
ncbi:hypothetical protein BGX31_003359 [Mortierella sp. GBA43]|nr:hypothetical protein BGX31_003359 [Mortierella sp. GBA43]